MPGRQQYSGGAGSPIRLRTSAADRQTTKSARYHQHCQQTIRDDDGEGNPDAWIMGKSHTSAIRYDYPNVPPRKTRGQPQRPASTKKTRVVGYRRFFVGRMLIIIGLLLLVLILGGMALSALGNWWQQHTQTTLRSGIPGRIKLTSM